MPISGIRRKMSSFEYQVETVKTSVKSDFLKLFVVIIDAWESAYWPKHGKPYPESYNDCVSLRLSKNSNSRRRFSRQTSLSWCNNVLSCELLLEFSFIRIESESWPVSQRRSAETFTHADQIDLFECRPRTAAVRAPIPAGHPYLVRSARHKTRCRNICTGSTSDDKLIPGPQSKLERLSHRLTVSDGIYKIICVQKVIASDASHDLKGLPSYTSGLD